MPFQKESLPIPAPRRSEPLDENAIRSQQVGGQPSINPLVPSEVEVDPMDIEAESDGFTPEDSDRPLARNVVEFEVNEDELFDGDMPVGVIL